VEIRPFEAFDLAAAADLYAGRYADERAGHPELPDAWERPERVAPLLHRLVAAGPALVAVDGDEVLGYLAGWLVDEPDGPWAYVPEWGHAARGPDRRRTWEELYAAVLPSWLERGARLHRVTLLAGDELIGALGWLSFGTTTVDAVRGTDAIGSDPYRVRRAGVADTDAVVRLREGLRQHLQGSPVYVVVPAPVEAASEGAKLADPRVATLLAEEDGKVLGFLRIGPAADDVATLVQDAGTASITGAFTVAGRRGSGVGTCLLDHALAWARKEGYVRVAVDFEAMNVLAARFWTATFRPVALTMTRAIDPRVSVAPALRGVGADATRR
jgi:GNAT superfamily N-acetyltransferase